LPENRRPTSGWDDLGVETYLIHAALGEQPNAQPNVDATIENHRTAAALPH
jgi:hypothetical protein